MLKIAHLSDLHFSSVTYNPSQFFSKRWIGNLNLIFSRRRGHSESQVEAIIDLLIQEKVAIVFITGDVSTTSRSTEFEKAAQFINKLSENGIKTIVLPGNHDHYTRSSYRKKLFYKHLTNKDFPYLFKEEAISLKDQKIEAVHIDENWVAIALDVIVPTSLVMSTGLFPEELEQRLISALEKIPKGKRVMILSHFPFFCNETLRKRLIRRKALKAQMEKYDVSIFMHGHTHNQTIANLYPELPLILDAGSCSYVKRGTFHIMDLGKDSVDVSVFCSTNLQWHEVRKESFSFEKLS